MCDIIGVASTPAAPYLFPLALSLPRPTLSRSLPSPSFSCDPRTVRHLFSRDVLYSFYIILSDCANCFCTVVALPLLQPLVGSSSARYKYRLNTIILRRLLTTNVAKRVPYRGKEVCINLAGASHSTADGARESVEVGLLVTASTYSPARSPIQMNWII